MDISAIGEEIVSVGACLWNQTEECIGNITVEMIKCNGHLLYRFPYNNFYDCYNNIYHNTYVCFGMSLLFTFKLNKSTTLSKSIT